MRTVASEPPFVLGSVGSAARDHHVVETVTPIADLPTVDPEIPQLTGGVVPG
jgi:hypothetical protein